MEIAVLFQTINALFIGIVVLLRFHKMIGLLVTTYGLVWGISSILLAVFNPDSLPFITLKGLAVIYGHLIAVLLGALYAYNFLNGGVRPRVMNISCKHLYFATLIISGIGLSLMLYTTDIWSYYVQNQLAEMRGDLFEQKIIVNKYYKLMGNFIYPLAIVAPIYYYRHRAHIIVLLSVVVFGALLSFSNGGKGNLIMVLILLLGGIVYMCKIEHYPLSKAIKRLSVAVVVLLGLFFYFIQSTRIEGDEAFSFFDTMVVINQYFSGSIPSLHQWIEINAIPLFNFDIGQLSIFREIYGVLGIETTRVIDLQIVNIPNPFNVFTGFADSLHSFGYLGSLVYYVLIGALLGFTDRQQKSPFLFGLLFLFIVYSLFTDIFFYMIGTWICLFFNYFFDLDETAD